MAESSRDVAQAKAESMVFLLPTKTQTKTDPRNSHRPLHPAPWRSRFVLGQVELAAGV
jgi:hypothetical protein